MPAPATPQGSSTRLLVLGCVRIFQPVHGYFLRRELVSWEVDRWAHVHPGSIYNALKSLTKAGLLEEVGVVAEGPRPPRTTYRLTDGRRGRVPLPRAHGPADDRRPHALPHRGEHGVRAPPRRGRRVDRDARIGLLEDLVVGAWRRRSRRSSRPRTRPDTATEVARLISARTRGELEWAAGYLDRVRGGAYAFQGEPPLWNPTPEQLEVARAAGVGPWVVYAMADEDT